MSTNTINEIFAMLYRISENTVGHDKITKSKQADCFAFRRKGAYLLQSSRKSFKKLEVYSILRKMLQQTSTF